MDALIPIINTSHYFDTHLNGPDIRTRFLNNPILQNWKFCFSSSLDKLFSQMTFVVLFIKNLECHNLHTFQIDRSVFSVNISSSSVKMLLTCILTQTYIMPSFTKLACVLLFEFVFILLPTLLPFLGLAYF